MIDITLSPTTALANTDLLIIEFPTRSFDNFDNTQNYLFENDPLRTDFDIVENDIVYNSVPSGV